jgi:predicted aldo/keto reductase-like oxidoreductase
MQKYAALPGVAAGGCLDCDGHCENACPHGIPVRALLTRAHQRLTLA